MATSETWYNRKKGSKQTVEFKLDIIKTPEENVVDIIQGLYLKKHLHNDLSPTSKPISSEGRNFMFMPRNVNRSSLDIYKLSHLNALVTLLSKEEKSNLGFTTDELMCCIRISLMDDSVVIRAGALRALRYMIKTESDVAVFNSLRLPYLVIRSMDLMLRNEEERTQALRVVRRIIAVVGPSTNITRRHRGAYLEPGLLRCLVAVARAGHAFDGSGDRLSRPAIATLAEIGILNPAVFVAVGGVGAVTRYLQERATPRMAEALCGVLLHALNDPVTRRAARVDLMCLCSPYCDFHYRTAGTDANRDDREMRFTCSRLALLCVLRSWPGLLHFCHPYKAGGLRALVHSLYLPRLEVRKAILDLLYELLGLSQPEWTDEISVALDAVDPSDFQDSWGLNEGFVAAEGIAILPHLSATGSDITEIHLALLLQCFLEAGLLDALAEVIITSDTFISVRATVLLGQLLHLIHLLLPPQICSITPAVPSLLSQAAVGKPQALAAIAALQRLNSMLEARPASNSLFLDHIMKYCCGVYKDKKEDSSKSRKEKVNASMSVSPRQRLHRENSVEGLTESDNELERRNSFSDYYVHRSLTPRQASRVSKSNKFLNLFDRVSDNLFRISLVMQNKDGNTWNWEIIRTILRENDDTIINLSDSSHRAWVGKIVEYLKPSSNKYSHADLAPTWQAHSTTRAGCQLIRHLIRHNDSDSIRLLETLFVDVSDQIMAIQTGKKAHECLFSPQHMCNTMCQMYFLFVGQLCHSQAGLKIFKETKLYENLLELSTRTHHSCYIKLVISSLDYTKDSYPRDILAKTLKCNIQSSRHYATEFLNVLLRASQKSHELLRRKMKLRKQERSRSKDDYDKLNGNDMETWILKMLVGQIKDENKAIVRCALSILEESCSVPSYLEKLITMREEVRVNCRLDKDNEPCVTELGLAGDRGYLLWLYLEATAFGRDANSQNTAIINKHLDFWIRHYNYRYVRLVEAEVHGALTLGEESEARGRQRRSARVPPHLYRALAAHTHCILSSAIAHHYKILKQARCISEQEIMDLKATLWAVGNTATSAAGVQLLMQLSNGCLEESPPVLIIRLAKFCAVYSIRAVALYVLGLFGSTYVGANLLSELGWLCVRHTRHDKFPVIHEENWSSPSSSTLHHLIMSPNRRFVSRQGDMEASEHSDHTDQSTVESLHSDHTKLSGNRIVTTITVERTDKDTVDHKTPDKRRSHTLPTQGGHSLHERPSLTESRTVDMLKDFSIFERTSHNAPTSEYRFGNRINFLDHPHHEGRVRNTSESSTSGVSSCDSVLGRYVFPDRVLTLSPIPSSSSLFGMKGGLTRPRLCDTQRRTSTSSYTAPDMASSPPSQRDMAGYATLKSLNIHRRPHLSESAASGSNDLDEISWMFNEATQRRTRAFSSLRDRAKATRERMTKLSLLDYDWKPITNADSGSQRQLSGVKASSPQKPPLAPILADQKGPCYIGICLPLNLMDLFPKGDTEEATLEGYAGETSFMMDTSTTTDLKLHTSPDNHSFTSNKGEASTAPWRHNPNNCLACVRTRPPSTHELREAFFADFESREEIASEVCSSLESIMCERAPQVDVLHHVECMANPIYHKQSRAALLSLKQRCPEIFRSMCIYSEVCALLSSGTYMMCARRFIQELFLDSPPECFLNEPTAVLARHLPLTPRSCKSVCST